LIITVGNEIDKCLFECFNSKDFSEILKDSFKDIKYNPSRFNVTYINFEDLKNSINLESESELKPYLKMIFKQISSEASEYFRLKNIYPFDYENLKTRSIYNFMQYKLKCKNSIFEVPEYLIKLKNETLLEIFKMGFNLKELEESFEKFVTFDKQYIFNILNTKRTKDIKARSSGGNNEHLYVNENKNEDETTDLKCIILKNRTEYIPIKHKKNNKQAQKENNNNINSSEEKEKNKISEVTCNICKERKINIAFGHCKHRYLCEDCVTNKMVFCPICKLKINKFIKLYQV